MTAELMLGDGIAWLNARAPRSVQAIVTDPPFTVRDFDAEHMRKMRDGTGGSWRQAPAFDGAKRAPLPRFTDLTPRELEAARAFFGRFACAAMHALTPGAHAIVASTPLLAHLVDGAMAGAGFERRGAVVRVVRTLRGGDRPKGAEREFPDVCAMARGVWEPWLVYRVPLEGTVAACLRTWGTGALRRRADGRPFEDVIASAPASRRERAVAGHPSPKPQAFCRAVVRASLPLASGLVVDPFAGSGAIVAAAQAVGYDAVGLELDVDFYRAAVEALPRLAAFEVAESA